MLPQPEPDRWRRNRAAPEPGTQLVPSADFADGEAREFRFGKRGAFSMFVVRRGDAFHGYVNKCPHYGTPLNERKPSFLTADGVRIRCSKHYSEFQIEDGLGIAGFGEGCWLEPVPLSVRDGVLTIS